jgi:hypothetical protein
MSTPAIQLRVQQDVVIAPAIGEASALTTASFLPPAFGALLPYPGLMKKVGYGFVRQAVSR